MAVQTRDETRAQIAAELLEAVRSFRETLEGAIDKLDRLDKERQP